MDIPNTLISQLIIDERLIDKLDIAAHSEYLREMSKMHITTLCNKLVESINCGKSYVIKLGYPSYTRGGPYEGTKHRQALYIKDLITCENCIYGHGQFSIACEIHKEHPWKYDDFCSDAKAIFQTEED